MGVDGGGAGMVAGVRALGYAGVSGWGSSGQGRGEWVVGRGSVEEFRLEEERVGGRRRRGVRKGREVFVKGRRAQELVSRTKVTRAGAVGDEAV